jgi:hypothetical protein
MVGRWSVRAFHGVTGTRGRHQALGIGDAFDLFEAEAENGKGERTPAVDAAPDQHNSSSSPRPTSSFPSGVVAKSSFDEG